MALRQLMFLLFVFICTISRPDSAYTQDAIANNKALLGATSPFEGIAEYAICKPVVVG